MGIPIFLPFDLPGLGLVVRMAVSADGSRLYAGRVLSGARDRCNLVVLQLDANGSVVVDPQNYPDSPVPLGFGLRSGIGDVLLDEARRKLYLTVSVGVWIPAPDAPSYDDRVLTVYDLDATGMPLGPPRGYRLPFPPPAGQIGPGVVAMARHPELNVLYLVSAWSSIVLTQLLDDSGEPVGGPSGTATGAFGKTSVAVGPALPSGTHPLYLGTYPDVLEVVDLDSRPGSGAPPLAASLRSIRITPPPAEAGYYTFHHTPQALYTRSGFEYAPSDTAPVGHFGTWPLDPDTGLPATPGPEPSPGLEGRAITVDGPGRRLWVASDGTFTDVLTGQSRVHGTSVTEFALGGDGRPAPAGPPVMSPAAGRQAIAAATGPGGPPIVVTKPVPSALPEHGDQVEGWVLRVTLVSTEPPTPGSLQLWLGLWPDADGEAVPVVVGGSADLSLDATPSGRPLLRGRAGPTALAIGVHGVGGDPSTQQITLCFEVFDRTPGPRDHALVRLEDTFTGATGHLVALGNEFAGTKEQRVAGIELLSGVAERHLEWARANGVAERDRPRRFIVSCYQLMGQQHRRELQAEGEALGLLGFNTVHPHWWGLPGDVIEQALDGQGIVGRRYAVYNPLEGVVQLPLPYFEFFLKDRQHDIDVWVDGRLRDVRAESCAPERVVLMQLDDEPSWDTAVVRDAVSADPGYLADFHAFLQRHGRLDAGWLGAPDVASVKPVTARHGDPVERRRLFYWTARYFAESVTLGHQRVAQTLEQAFGHPMTIYADWQAVGSWYVRGFPPSALEGAGFFDWFHIGRLGALNPWVEDTWPDRAAQSWSTVSGTLRCVSMLGDRNFGAYVKGNYTGRHPAGTAYKIMSMVGNGARAIDVYDFGPGVFTGDAWSENPGPYRTLPDALRMLGRAEHLLYPGRPRRGQVAILTSTPSSLWDDDVTATMYGSEIEALHWALIHAGYTVDLVDPVDIAGDALTTRGYRALYLTTPNLQNDYDTCYEKIERWVHDHGGVLAVTPGAGVADEYNEPCSVLDAVLGLGPRTAERSAHAQYPARYDEVLTPTDPAFGDAPLYVAGPHPALVPASADTDVLATFGGGTAALTRHRHGNGIAIAYGCYPGHLYLWTADGAPDETQPLDPRRLPRGWGRPERQLAVVPADLAGITEPVRVSHPLVQALLLESDAGTAVVLLNWSDDPIGDLEVVLPAPAAVGQVRTASGAALAVHREASALRVRMPLTHVDVVLVEP